MVVSCFFDYIRSELTWSLDFPLRAFAFLGALAGLGVEGWLDREVFAIGKEWRVVRGVAGVGGIERMGVMGLVMGVIAVGPVKTAVMGEMLWGYAVWVKALETFWEAEKLTREGPHKNFSIASIELKDGTSGVSGALLCFGDLEIIYSLIFVFFILQIFSILF